MVEAKTDKRQRQREIKGKSKAGQMEMAKGNGQKKKSQAGSFLFQDTGLIAICFNVFLPDVHDILELPAMFVSLYF